MVDKANAPTDGDVSAADIDPAGNTDFLNDMLGNADGGGYTHDDAVQRITQSDGLLEGILGDNPSEGEDDDASARSASDEQGDEPSEEDDEHQEADEDEQGDEPSGEKSEDEDGFELLTRDEKGKLKKLGLDDVEVPFELDGEEQFLTLADIQQELKDNRLRRDDYSRKTQDLSRRVSEEVQKQTAERQAELDQGYDRLEVVLNAFGGQLDRDVSFEELKKQYGGDAEKAGNALSQMQAFREKLNGAQQDMAARRSATVKANIESTISTLQGSIPEWRDNRVLQKDLGAMREFFLSEGLNSDDIAAIFQAPNFVNLARKAFEGDRLMKRTKTVARKKTAVRLGKNQSKTVAPKPRHARKANRAAPDPFAGLNGGTAGLSQSEGETLAEKALFG